MVVKKVTKKPLTKAQQQFGNKNALGCTTSGTPRTVSLSKEEMIALGEEMLKWLDEHPNTVHLCEWYSITKMFHEERWRNMRILPEFKPYYDKALKIIGIKYLQKNDSIRDNIAPRWLRHYFKDCRDDDTNIAKEKLEMRLKELEYEIKLKSEALLTNQDAPLQTNIDIQHKIMKLEQDLEAANEIIKNANLVQNKSEAK